MERKVTQKFTPAEYKTMKDIKFFAHYDSVNVLHDPTYVGEEQLMDPEELKALIAEYTEMFGKAPANNAKPENIKNKVEFGKLSVEFQIKHGKEVPADIKTVEALKEALAKDAE